ncbi:hypothetical protein CBD41_02585, partial [bacterium TMED181]
MEAKMNHSQKLRFIAGGFALIAMWMCFSLLSIHAAKTPDLGLLAGVCGDSGENCTSVVNGRWGVFPPGEAGSEGPHEGIPVAGMGWIYFTVLAAWYLFVAPVVSTRGSASKWVLGLNGLGALGSVAYTLIMLLQIGTTCGLCLISHGCNWAILLVGLLLEIQKKEESKSEVSVQRLMATVSVLVLSSVAISFLVRSEGENRARYIALEEQTRELVELAKDIEKVETAYRSSPQRFEQSDIRK